MVLLRYIIGKRYYMHIVSISGPGLLILQCGAIVTRSVSTEYSQWTLHSSPMCSIFICDEISHQRAHFAVGLALPYRRRN